VDGKATVTSGNLTTFDQMEISVCTGYQYTLITPELKVFTAEFNQRIVRNL